MFRRKWDRGFIKNCLVGTDLIAFMGTPLQHYRTFGKVHKRLRDRVFMKYNCDILRNVMKKVGVEEVNVYASVNNIKYGALY